MSLVSDVVEDARVALYGIERPILNFLDGTIDASQLTLTLADEADGIDRGTYLGIDFEDLYVRARTDLLVTVRRAQLGSLAAVHTDDTEIEVNPRYSRGRLLTLGLEEIRSWTGLLFRVPSAEVIPISGDSRGYDLTALGDFHNILAVRRDVDDASNDTNVWRTVRQYTVDRNAPIADFASGAALYVKDTFGQPRLAGSGDRLAITYSTGFDVSTWLPSTDLITTVGLEAGMEQVLKFGMLWRALSTAETSRTDTSIQNETRLSEDVPPGHRTGVARELKRTRDELLADQRRRLLRRYPLSGS